MKIVTEGVPADKDENYQQKCGERRKKLQKKTVITLLLMHNAMNSFI
jgi:hypothetical protein